MKSSGTEIDRLRRHAVGRSLFEPMNLDDALRLLGFVQADPIRAPARAQDLVLRHRVAGYRAGDLDRSYSDLQIEEDFFVNYGFVQPGIQALMHPRTPRTVWDTETWAQAREVVGFIRERGEVHPLDVHRHFARGTVKNVWGGMSSATTKMLDSLHYRGFLRIARRESGIRIYATKEFCTPVDSQADVDARLDALVDAVVRKYAPLTAVGLTKVAGQLRYGVPQWRSQISAAIGRAKKRLGHMRISGVDWYWPQEEQLPGRGEQADEKVYLLSPFDPVVWDRARFEMLWGWAFRFEGYIPPGQRRFGYYALPLLWRDQVVGWVNAAIQEKSLVATINHVDGMRPKERAYPRALESEFERICSFLEIESMRCETLS